MKYMLAGLSALSLLAGCGPSPEQVEVDARKALQQRLEAEPSVAHLPHAVHDVALIDGGDSRFEGTAQLEVAGQPFTLTLSALADRRRTVVQVSEAAWSEALLAIHRRRLAVLDKQYSTVALTDEGLFRAFPPEFQARRAVIEDRL